VKLLVRPSIYGREMDRDQRLGMAFRRVRLRRKLRQVDVARAAGVSRSVISLLERGHVEGMSLGTIRKVCAALDIRLDLVARWRGGDLDRLLNARHSALHEAVARLFEGFPSWTAVPEVSFAIYHERGVIDILAWHAASRTILVIELKTEFVDVQEMTGSVDRKERLARRIARERGWPAERVAVWVAVADSRTNRRHLAAHRTMLRNAFPTDGRSIRSWLRRPTGTVRALGFVGVAHATPSRRVRAPRAAAA